MTKESQPSPEFERLAGQLRQDRPTTPVMLGNFVPAMGQVTLETEQPDVEPTSHTDGSVALHGAEVSVARALDNLPPRLRAKTERMRNL